MANNCKPVGLSVVGDGCPDSLVLLPDGSLKLIEVKNPQCCDRVRYFFNVTGENLLSL